MNHDAPLVEKVQEIDENLLNPVEVKTPQVDGLLVEEISLSGRLIIVSEANGYMGVQRGTIIAKLQNSPVDDPYLQRYLEEVYAPLVSCSSGDVPKTPNEFMSLRETDIEAWIQVAKKYNPAWFEWLTIAEEELRKALTPETKKKKEQSKQK